MSTLLIDMDPQAQVTQWLGAGDGLSPQGTLNNYCPSERRQTLGASAESGLKPYTLGVCAGLTASMAALITFAHSQGRTCGRSLPETMPDAT
jgi:hypothetical protein